jgi:hypothetical protein
MKQLLGLLLIGALLSCKDECEVGTPDPNCMCTMEYDPVCGCNKVTYGNACQANCAGVSDFTEGECAE